MFNEDGSSAPEDLPIHLWAQDYELVDIFDWQESVEGMVTAAGLSRVLRKSEGWVLSRWLSGEIKADEIVELGGRNQIPYFLLDRVAGIRSTYGFTEVTEDNIYEDFLRFLATMDMTYSYKPVWFRAVLENIDERGRSKVEAVNAAFHQFYQERAAKGCTTERRTSKMAAPGSLSRSEVQQVINQGPFNRFSRLDFVGYAHDRAYYEIHRRIWEYLRKPTERERALQLCNAAIESYFQSLTAHD